MTVFVFVKQPLASPRSAKKKKYNVESAKTNTEKRNIAPFIIFSLFVGFFLLLINTTAVLVSLMWII